MASISAGGNGLDTSMPDTSAPSAAFKFVDVQIVDVHAIDTPYQRLAGGADLPRAQGSSMDHSS